MGRQQAARAVATALLWATAANALAAEQAPTPRSQPSSEDVLEAQPRNRGQRLIGNAVLDCAVTTAGALTACRVASENPPGAGLGTAALSLAGKYAFAPAVRDGSPVEARTTVTVFFDQPPTWLRAPSQQDLAAVFPTRAVYRSYDGGAAVLRCQITVHGVARDCRIKEEHPADVGFGTAAVEILRTLLWNPALRDGVPIEAEKTVKIVWSGFAYLGDREHVHDREMGTAKIVPQAAVPWSAAPGAADVLAAYPQAARSKRLGGVVVLECTLHNSGRLGNCIANREEPRGQGFATAARSLAEQFRFRADDPAGSALVGSDTQLTFTFDAASIDSPTAKIGRPQWVAFPTAEDLTTAFGGLKPPGDLSQARVMLGCRIADGGALAECQPQSESPAGAGFGAAAVTLSGRFRVSLWTDEGLPTIGGALNLPIRYELQAPAK